MNEQIDTGFKKTRGMARASLDLIERMAAIIEEIEPVTGRGVGYKLFTAGLIPSMSVNNMQRVYRLLKRAREDDLIPWEYIVDETRGMEKVSAWDNPKDFAESVASQYRRDFWAQQPNRCEVWSEKGTVRGILKPVLDEYGVGFRVMHGFASATIAHEIAEDDDGREMTALYVGDYDPSGLYMSERDLPDRLEMYGGFHVEVKRIALIKEQLSSLPSFPATDSARTRVTGGSSRTTVVNVGRSTLWTRGRFAISSEGPSDCASSTMRRGNAANASIERNRNLWNKCWANGAMPNEGGNDHRRVPAHHA